MKYTPLLLFCFVLLISCSSGGSKQIELFNHISYNLSENEENREITEVIKNEYKNWTRNASPNMQLPLFRFVQSPGYKTFIALPYKTSMADLRDSFFLLHPDSCIVETETNTPWGFYRSYQKGSEFIATQALSVNDNTLYVILISDTAVARSQGIDKNFILNKINIDE